MTEEPDPLLRFAQLLSCHVWGYDRQGQPLTGPEHWGRLHSDLAYLHVRATMVADVEVSTVWTGLPQAGSTPERPLIFETMTFGGPTDGWAWRYATEEEAEAGHDQVVAEVRERLEASLRGQEGV